MINFIKIPNTVDLVKNNIGVIVEGTNHKISNGRKGWFKLYKNDVLTAGTLFIFPDFIDLTNFNIDVKTQPDDSGYQVTSDVDIDITAAELRENYILNRKFNISVSGSYLIFETKEIGDYQIDLVDNLGVSTSESRIQTVPCRFIFQFSQLNFKKEICRL